MLSSASKASSPIERATAEFQQVRGTILTQSRELAKVTQLKMPITSLGDSVAFYKNSEKCSKSEIAAVTTESMQRAQLFHSVRAEMADM